MNKCEIDLNKSTMNCKYLSHVLKEVTNFFFLFFTLSLNWYFVNWGSNRSRVFCTLIELSQFIVLLFKSISHLFIILYNLNLGWYGGYSTSINACRVWGTRAGVQVSRRELHTYTLRLG